jgi:hypothetical protein
MRNCAPPKTRGRARRLGTEGTTAGAGYAHRARQMGLRCAELSRGAAVRRGTRCRQGVVSNAGRGRASSRRGRRTTAQSREAHSLGWPRAATECGAWGGSSRTVEVFGRRRRRARARAGWPRRVLRMKAAERWRWRRGRHKALRAWRTPSARRSTARARGSRRGRRGSPWRRYCGSAGGGSARGRDCGVHGGASPGARSALHTLFVGVRKQPPSGLTA